MTSKIKISRQLLETNHSKRVEIIQGNKKIVVAFSPWFSDKTIKSLVKSSKLRIV